MVRQDIKSTKLNHARQKIHGFSLRDKRGEEAGRVEDLIKDSISENYFNVVIASKNKAGEPYYYLLNSRYLRRVDIAAQSLFSTLLKEDLQQLPKYEKVASESNREEIKFSISGNTAAPVQVSQPPPDIPASTHSLPQSSPIMVNKPMSDELNPFNQSDILEPSELKPSEPEVLESDRQQIRLLEERLVVHHAKRKAGEIIVRKMIETRMVEVPVRREKLIVEQVGSPGKTLAEIDIGLGDIQGIEAFNTDSSTPVVKGKFNSLKTVAQVLDVLSKTTHYRCNRIRVELVLGNGELQQTYHEFMSLKAARQVIDAIADNLQLPCRDIQVEVMLDEAAAKDVFQKWFDRYSSF